MNNLLSVSEVKTELVKHLEQQGYTYVHGHTISPDGESPERDSYEQVLLTGRLRLALQRINPVVDQKLIEQVITELLRTPSSDLITSNEHFHYCRNRHQP